MKLGREAYEALSKLQSKLEVGMSFMAYMDALGDAHHVAKKFLESPEAMEVPKFTKQIIIADNAFREAGDIWGKRIKAKFGKTLFVFESVMEDIWFRTAFKALKTAKLYLDQIE